MHVNRPLTLLIFFLFIFFYATAYEHPGGMHTQEQIDFVKERIQQKPYYEAYLQLIDYADAALKHESHALTDFDVPGFYIDSAAHRANSKSLQSDAFDAYAAALAYQLSRDEKYAEKALDFLMAWANQNTQYSNHDGSLVMAYSGTSMIIAADLLYTYTNWGKDDKAQFFSWAKNVYRKACNEIRERKNNWADWGRFGSILTAHLLDDTTEVEKNIQLIRSDLFHKIADDGHMPEEVRREKNGIWYTYFSLAPITAACWVALQAEEIDLFTYQVNGKSIKSALDYLLYHTQHPEQWKWFEHPRPGSPEVWPENLFEAMHGIYGDEAYEAYVEKARPLSYPMHHFAWSFPTLMKPLKVYENSAVNQDLEVIRERVITELMERPINQSEIQQLINTIQEDGSWPGINYEDVSRTGFEHAIHLQNMIALSRAYKKQESKFYHDPQLKQVIDASFNFWLEHNFICDNWWWNQIGTPDRLVSILLIMDESLSDVQKEKVAPIVGRANLGAWGARPGGDLIKIAGILGKYALFTRGSETLEEVVKTMASEISYAKERNTPEDMRGLQTDLSFHHRRDRVTSTLSYGLGYADAFAEWAAKVAGTQYSFPEDRIRLLVDFYLDGISKTMVYGKYPDPGAKNRSITRAGTLQPYNAETPLMLLQATDYRKEELKEIADIRNGEAAPKLTFNKFFWHTEYLSHQRPDYFTSVRMFSSRNHSMEQPYNGEGLKNHHLGDGANFISKTGEEYLDIFPIWDWQKIPGTTVVQKPDLPSEEEIQKEGLTDFVGAVTDGTYGAASFDFKSPLDPLEARKAWFMFDEEYVCLGTAIRSEANYPVATTLNQAYLHNDVVVMQKKRKSTLQKGEHKLKKVGWIYHDDIAYIFPNATEVHLKNQEASGSWYSINRQADSPKEEISNETFTVWLDHGKKPKNEDYAYIVVPSIKEGSIENYRENLPIKILANTEEIQAVQHTSLGSNQIIFYQPNEVQLSEEVKLTAVDPAIVMIQMNGQSVEKISVADPSRKLDTIHLKVNSRINTYAENCEISWHEDEGNSDIVITLPKGEFAGKSVTIKNSL
ncbi:polysaccharide lyase family 8 super-sandwich domain-containing protein [Catalinimonas sp. 4WD22]|uniref:polysaccharide lyase family 8 super-sandwich domain-containing protein n=1 Tax=Catalinimonas locisalis TaxID=3133978 RepID=UPI0031019963